MITRSLPSLTLVTALSFAALIIVVLPLVAILFYGLFTIQDGQAAITLEPLRSVLSGRGYWMALGNTLLVSFGATLIATVAGTCLAWVVVRTNTPFARLLERLATLPIFIPPLVGGVAWILLSAPRIGLFNVVLRHLGFGEHFDIYQRAGIVWVMGIYLAPYVMMVVASALRNMDPNLEDAAHVSGLGDFRTLQIITLPVMAPAILSGAALVFVMVIGIFGTPMLLGWPRQILLLTSRIYLEWNQHPRALGVIAVLTVYLIILSSAANLLMAWLLGGRSYVTVSGKGYRPRIIRLGRARYILCASVFFYLAITIFAPLAVILAGSLSTYTWSGTFTADNLSYLWSAYEVYFTFRNSLEIATLSATVATVVGLAVVWISARTDFRGRRFLEYVVMLPIGVPGMAFGVGVALFWLRIPINVYDTILIVVLAYVGRYSSYAVRVLSASLAQIHPDLEESARVCGYGGLRTFLRITMPLVRSGIGSSWILLYSILMTELSMITILQSSQSRTIATLTFDTWDSGDFSKVCSLALLQLIAGVLVLVGVQSIGWLTSGRGPVT